MKFALMAAIAGSALALAGCGRTSMTNRNAPDEFAITKSAPLIVPPDFALAPPKPGEPRPVGQDGQSEAVEALFGPGVKAPPKSAAERQLLDKAGATKTDPAIRSNVGDATSTVDKGGFLLELMSAPPGAGNPAVATVRVGG